MDKIEIGLKTIMVISLLAIGWIGNNIYRYYDYQADIRGLYLSNNNYTLFEAQKYAENTDYMGRWVCVNVRGISYKEGVAICQHEIGHEMFADVCMNNMSKCEEVLK